MRATHVNELEERRVIRLLHELAETVEPLPAGGVDDLLATPPAPARRGRRPARLRPRDLVAAAAAAALVLGTTFASSVPGSRSAPPGPASAPTRLASFPDGSALTLLLSANGSERRW